MFEWITDEMFDEQLRAIVREEGESILSVPGVYEVLREHFNNEVINQLCDSNDRDRETGEEL